MKTVIELPDALFQKASTVATEFGMTLDSLVEFGLQAVVSDLRQPKACKMKDASVGAFGLQPGQENLI